MSEARLPTYIVALDADEYIYPLAATLTKARADRLVAEIVDHFVEEARRRWKILFDDDPEGVRPFDEDATRKEAGDRIVIANWDVPFVESESPTDPHVFKLAVQHEEDHFDGDLFLS